ncbi:MerR family transcriptional regulator [Bacillus bingmayongensis]|uniref:MerR family transcriptional regulator n=1 Tax=Bacillus bingmayongensis TaxID=1150157 RepID=UPI001C8EDD77|nr:MerR family transcriptional regulator [Bacillus bingmayongensis]MBY0594979.1 MerR family transcriptional regulator [Bacillus bingmayongensis]
MIDQKSDDDILNDNVFEKAWRITEFSKLVGRHHNTVYNWFNILEEKGLHETLRTHNTNEKLYNTLDLEIALFIKQKRDEKWSLDAIIELLPHQFDLRPVPLENQANEVSTQLNLQATAEIIEKMVNKQIEEKIKTIESQYEEKIGNILKQLPQPEDAETLKIRQRQERLDNFIIEHRARQELRKQAESLWNSKPDEERIKKVGWFKKEEDLAKKQLFIEQYIHDNIIDHMKSLMNTTVE